MSEFPEKLPRTSTIGDGWIALVAVSVLLAFPATETDAGPAAGSTAVAAAPAAAGRAEPGAGAQSAESPSPESRVDDLLAAYDNTRAPGCAVGVIRDGELVLKRGYGMANLEYGIPLSSQTVFRIGSTSKQFTAASILLLAQDGKLSLDDDVRKYLPELHDFGAPVTIRQLMHHTSGYRDYLTLMSLAGRREFDYYDDEELLATLSRQRALNFAPGDEFLYSNSGYWLLSQVVARAAGVSLREYAANRIFGPLGMDASHYHDDHTEIVANRAGGYAPAGDESYRISMTTLPMLGDGGVFTTVEDLFLWDQNFYDPQIGSPGLIEQMTTTGALNNGEKLTYAAGLYVDTYRGLRTVSHGGAFVGFRAELLRFPEQRFSVICLCNRSDANPSRIARRVAEFWLEDRMAPVADADRDRGDRSRPEPLEVSAADLADYAGDYYSDELDVTYRLRLDDDGITFAVGVAPPRRLSAFAPDILGVGALRLRFGRGEQGAISGFELDAGRVKNLRFTRVSAP